MKIYTNGQLRNLASPPFLKYLLLQICIVASLGAFAQGITISGTVTSSEDAGGLPGVNVVIKGSVQGTVTDVNGAYQIEVPGAESILVFSSVGYITEEIAVGNQTVIDLNMSPDVTALEEIVVIGYGTQRKSHLTGAVSKVKNENLDQIPLSRVDDALIGQVSGINIQQTNPAAGEAPTIRVRGNGSITSFPNPLVVVDGVAVSNDYLGSIDMNDVESVEILKDAASAAIYGSRGANGVIMITTKKGQKGATVFSYNGYVGYKSVPENDVLTSIDDWANFVKENNNGELTDRMKYIQMIGNENDWQKIIMDGGMIQSHSLSARGGSDKTKFSISGSYLNDEGVLLTDKYEKINLRINLSTKVNKVVELGMMLNPQFTNQRRFPIGVHDAMRQSPWLPLYLDENTIQYVNRDRESGRWADAQIGDYGMERMFDDYDLSSGMPIPTGGTDISTTSNQSSLAKVLERDRINKKTKIFTNLYLKLNFTDYLSLRSSVGGDYRYSRNRNYQGILADRRGAARSSAEDNSTVETHIVTEHMLNFNKSLGKHDINAIAGFAYERWDLNYSGITAAGYNFDYITTIPSTNVTGASTYESAETLISYIGRINYAYNSKYLASISLRSDGSSKFGPDNKFGFFPAISAGWRVTEEPFLQDNATISDLKLRVSYGTTGNNSGIGRYDHIGLVVPVGAVFNGGISNGFNASNISNSELQWEKSVEFNPGLDIGLFEGKLNMSFDYYKRRSENLLLSQPIPSVTGFQEALVNLGIVENSGFEFELSSTNINKGDFTWQTSGNMSVNKNELVDFAGADGLISVVDPKRPAEWIAQVGQPIASFYGYVVDKEIPLNYIKNPLYPINAESQDIYVRDLNGDGLIDTDDRTILGSPFPKLIWSVTNTMKYRNFDLSFMFQGSHGAKVRNMDPQYINNQFSSNQDYITDSSDPNFFPDAALVKQRIFTNDIVMDASYISLRNLNLGYTFSNVDKIGLKRARLYVSAQNLLYIMGSDYRGYNPEGINQGLDSPLTYGYQRGAAPIYRTWSVGLNLEF